MDQSCSHQVSLSRAHNRRINSLYVVVLLLLLCVSVHVVSSRTGVTAARKPLEKTAVSLPFEHTEELTYEAEYSKLLLRGIKIADLRCTAERSSSLTAPTPAAINTTPNTDTMAAVVVATTTTGTSAAAAPSAAAAAVAPAVKAAPTAAPAAAPAAAALAATNHRFVCEAVSSGWFRKLFGLRFRFFLESRVDPLTFAILRTSKIDEQGERQRISEAVFDHTAAQVVWTERDPKAPARPPRIVTAPLNDQVHDVISALYFLRTQPLIPGHRFELSMSDSGQIYKVPVKVVETKKIETVFGEAATVRVDIEVFGDKRPVPSKGELSLWLTTDARRIPVRARINSEMGTLTITLKSIKN